MNASEQAIFIFKRGVYPVGISIRVKLYIPSRTITHYPFYQVVSWVLYRGSVNYLGGELGHMDSVGKALSCCPFPSARR